MATEKEEKRNSETSPDNRLGTPLKRDEGLSSDKKRAESEHLHAFRDDVNIGHEDDEKKEK